MQLSPELGISLTDLGHQKTRVLPGLSCGVVYVILRLAVSVEHRLVTDGQTDGRTHPPKEANVHVTFIEWSPASLDASVICASRPSRA